jgi:hypothetical protein
MLIRDKPAQPILSPFPRKHGQVPKTLTYFQDGIKERRRALANGFTGGCFLSNWYFPYDSDCGLPEIRPILLLLLNQLGLT